MRVFLFLFIFCFAVSAASAQQRSFGTLPLVQMPEAPQFSSEKIEDTPEYKKALAVYERLVQARGDFRFPVPTFVLSADERNVAYARYDQLEIGLEKKAYDVCAGFGEHADAAIAFLLGHELTHYYEKHAWRRGFVTNHKDLEIGIKLDSLADAVANETEADYLGGFLAYSAGFGLFDKGGELIERLYQAYKLPPKLDNYPSLSDRQTLSKRSAERLARLVDVFDMANLLTAVGSYREAYAYYRYILMEYQSRETYNNLGAAAVLDALQYFNPNELKFRFPVELDLESSASKGDGMVDTRNQLLQEAILHFDAAISLDPNYAPAYLNKATAFALLGDNLRARFYADTEARQAAQRGNFSKTAIDIDILIGILDWREGNADKAEAAFQNAAAKGSALAAHNLKQLRPEPKREEMLSAFGALTGAEEIDNQTLGQISRGIRFDRNKSISIDGRLVFHQNPAQGENSRLFINAENQSRNRVLMHITGPDYKGKTAMDIGLKADRAAIVREYGKPTSTVETPRGEIMVYSNILFILGPDGKLERWATYEVIKR